MRYEPEIYIIKYFDELGSKAKQSTSATTFFSAQEIGANYLKENPDHSFVILRVLDNSKISRKKWDYEGIDNL